MAALLVTGPVGRLALAADADHVRAASGAKGHLFVVKGIAVGTEVASQGKLVAARGTGGAAAAFRQCQGLLAVGTDCIKHTFVVHAACSLVKWRKG